MLTQNKMQIEYTHEFINLINNSGINYCVLRNFKSLPRSTGKSDFDILIHDKCVNDFNKLIKQFIELHKLKLVSLIDDKHCPKYCILTTNWGIQIDAFKKSVYFGNKEIISSSVLFENIENYKGVQVLNQRIGALLAFLKELLNNKVCKKKYILDLQNQFQNQDINAQFLSQFSQKFIFYLNKNLNNLDEKHCVELYKLTKKKFRKYKFYGIKNKVMRFSKQPGFSIAFLGVDGSGKSTIIDNITPILNQSFHNSIYYEHMRPNKLPSIARLLGGNEEFNKPVTNPHKSKPSGFFVSLLRWLYYTIDYTFGFYLKVWPKKAIRSCVWIFDRYYYDYLLDSKRAKIKLPRLLIKLGQFLINEPDLILCLGTDPKTIHDRKPELTIDEVERQVEALKEFSMTHKQAVWIDTGVDIEISSNNVMKAIVNMMSKRFHSINFNK